MAAVQTATAGRQPRGMRIATRLFNRLIINLAGTRWMPLYGVITHRGRRSGRVFLTPVVVRAVADGFVVPLPWGDSTDWCRNVRAAGGCVIRWKDRDYRMVDPRVLDMRQAVGAFSAFQQRLMPRLGIKQALHLRFAN